MKTTSALAVAPVRPGDGDVGLPPPPPDPAPQPGRGRTSRPRGVVGWLGQVVAWLVILSLAAVLVAAVLVPRLAGATPYTVLTGSMRPDYPPGTMLVVRPTDPADILVGQVVTFQLESGRPEVVSHRVIGTRLDPRGDLELLVRGDANAVPDAEPVRAVQVRGTLWYALPYLGHATRWLTPERRQVVTYAVAAALAAYSGLMSARTFRHRHRHRAHGRGRWRP